MNTPKTLLFDLGGVVIDIDFNRVFAIWAGYAGCDTQQIRDRFKMDQPYRDHETGKISGTEFFAGLRRSLDIQISDAEFLEGWNAIFLGERPGMEQELARAAQAFPIYAFSNTNEIHKAVMFSRYARILSHFKTVFISSDLGARKPDAKAFTLVAERMEAGLGQILLFDDTQENIDGAQAIGMQTVLVKSVDEVKEALDARIA